mgnify:CR=1 FL=1
MKIWQRLAVALVFLGFLATASAQTGDPERGASLAGVCSACHGVDGNSLNPEWPKLAGQHASYLATHLQHYRSGARVNVLMSGQAANLGDQDILDLAAYYAGLEIAVGEADPALAGLGETIYQRGLAAKNVPACASCHGPAGQGVGSAVFPSLYGQHAAYTGLQLKLYRSGERNTDPNRMMRGVAAQLTDEEIAAVASYLQGLSPAGN